MTDSTPTLPLQKLEEHFDIPGLLVELGYASIFDILQKSRKEVTDQHQGQFGENAWKIYDTAASYATQILQQLRQKPVGQTVQGTSAIPLDDDTDDTQLLTATATQQTQNPLLTSNSPTWQSLFSDNWSEYCQNGSPEAVDSPVSYLSWLYNQAMSFEMQMGAENILPLTTRRPDLAELMLDDDAINQGIPALQLVNEVLEDSITPYVSSVNSASTVTETLSTTHYPSSLPYHYPHQQTLVSLEACGTSLQESIKKADTVWPYFVKENLRTGKAETAWQLGSDLAPEQLAMMTEMATTDDAFYLNNLGMKYNNLRTLALTDNFCRQTDLTKQQMEQLLACTEGGTSVVVSENYPCEGATSADYGARYIHQNESNPINLVTDPGFNQISDQYPLTLNNVTTASGKFGECIKVDATVGAEAYFSDTISSADGVNKDFTLAFWCKIPSDVNDLALIATNKTDHYAGSSKGISLFAHRKDDKVQLQLDLSDGNSTTEEKAYADIPVDTWFFVCLRQDTINKVVHCIYSFDDLTLNQIPLWYSSLNTIAHSNSFWGFNGNKNNSYYNEHSNCKSVIYYDTITVWERKVTDTDLQKFMSSNPPGWGDSTIFNSWPIISSRLNNLSDSRMARIDRMARLQRWLDIPFDQTDSLACTSAVVNDDSGIMGLNGPRLVEGKFGYGYEVDATKGDELYFPDDISTVNGESASFSLTFWCKIPSNSKDLALIVTNKITQYAGSDKGISLFVHKNGSQYQLQLGVSDDVSPELQAFADIPTDEWIFICLNMDASSHTVNCHYSKNGSTLDKITIDYSDLTSITQQTCFWGFNGNKNNKYYNIHGDRKSVLYYDDITAWKRCLTESEIKQFILSKVPAGDYSSMDYYFPCNNLAVKYNSINADANMTVCNVGYETGKFGQCAKIDSALKQKAYFPDTVSSLEDASTNFTLTFWCKLPADTKELAAIVTNKTDHYALSSKGITLFAHKNDNKLQLQLTASDGSSNLSAYADIPTDTWVFITLSLDTASNTLFCHYSIDNNTLKNISVDYTSLDSIALTNSYWGFNGNNGDHYYNEHKDRECIIYYNDITVWNKKLTEAEMTNFLNTTIPAGGYSTMLHYYPFNSAFAFNVDPRRLAVFEHYQKNYQVSPHQFASVLDVLSPYAISPEVPFFDQVFNSSTVLDEPFKITEKPFNYTSLTGDDSRIVKQICAALGITRSQLVFLANNVNAAQYAPANTLICSLNTISALYRLVMVPRWLGLSFNDGIALLMLVENGNALNRLASVPVYNPAEATEGDLLDTLMALSDAAQWLSDNNLTATGMLALMQTSERVLPATTEELNFIAELNQQIPPVSLTEDSFRTVTKPGLNTLTGTVFTPVADSPTGNGFELDSRQGQYCQVNSDINRHINGETSYTLGTWVRFPEKITDDTPVLLNSTIYSAVSNDLGIYVLAQTGQTFLTSLHDSNGFVYSPSKTLKFTTGCWFYLALSMDVEAKELKIYTVDQSTQSVDSATIDWSASSGSITPEGNAWALNEDGALSYYDRFSTRKAVIQYDNLTVWDEAFSEETITQIAASDKKAGDRTDYLATTMLENSFSWMNCLSDIVDSNGLVYPVTTLPNTDISTQINNKVLADINTCIFPNATREQVAETITEIIVPAKLSQDGIADSAMAKILDIDHVYPPYLLSWAGSSEYELLNQSLALKNITSPDAIPDSYQQYLYEIARRAGLCATFNLTPAMLATYLTHPDWFGVEDTTIDFNLVYLFSRYSDWMKLADNEDNMLAYLRRVNGTPALTKEKAATMLAVVIDWESDEVQQAAEHANSTTGIATTLQHIDTVMRLKDLCSQTGTSVETVVNVGNLTTSSNYQQWQSVGESLIAAPSNH